MKTTIKIFLKSVFDLCIIGCIGKLLNIHTVKNHAFVLIIGIVLFPAIGQGQFNSEIFKLDFGNIIGNQNYVNLHLQNQSQTKIHTVYQINGESTIVIGRNLDLYPGGIETIRLPLIISKTGKYKDEIILQFNDCENLSTLILKGIITGYIAKSSQDCPDFSKNRNGKFSVKNDRTKKINSSKFPEFLVAVNDEFIIAPKPLSLDKYKKNNLFILVDVSSSMQSEEKTEMVRASFNGLAEVMRPVDQITILSYSGNAEIVMHPTLNLRQSELMESLDKLKIKGYTNGSLGLKFAYRLADSLFMHAANNEIILITDGAFNANETDDIENRIIKKYAGSGIKLSIIGIENRSWAIKELKALCEAGNGDYSRTKSDRSARLAMKKTIKNHSQR